MIFRRKKKGELVIGPDSKVADVVAGYPQALELLIEMGFEPLRNPIARKTVARLFSLRQAAAFRGVDLDDMLRRLRDITGQGESDTSTSRPASDPVAHGLDETSDEANGAEPAALEDNPPHEIPELRGDLRVLGMVPCPVRGTLVERFDTFAHDLSTSTGEHVAWWLGGEGVATSHVRAWLSDIHHTGRTGSLPDVFLAVGTELFYHPTYGSLATSDLFDPFPRTEGRPELRTLEDPRGILGLQFAVLFTLLCRQDGAQPAAALSWNDLASPELRGEIGLPSLDLPIIPDLLMALHTFLGEERFALFADNVGATMHPAQSSPRLGKRDLPSIMILPTLFARAGAVTGGVEVVPQEGPVAVPAYVAVRRTAPESAREVVKFLFSDKYLQPLWAHGRFFPNSDRITAEIPSGRLVTGTWNPATSGSRPAREPDYQSYVERLVNIVKHGAGR